MTAPDYSRAQGLVAKIHSEGYCCLYGYLRLCQARGEKPAEMAAFISISPDAIWHHYRRLKAGQVHCQKIGDCLQPVIEAIEKDKGP